MLDAQHSLAGLNDDEFDRGVLWLSEGLCPHCMAPLARTTNRDGVEVGQCPRSEWGYRLEQSALHGPQIVSTGPVSIRIGAVHDGGDSA